MEKDQVKTLEKLLDLSAALSSEQDKTRLLQKIIVGAKELTHADGGTLYTVTDNKKLRFEIILNDSLKIEWQREQFGEAKLNFPDIQLFDDQGKPNDKTVAAFAVNHDKIINIANSYEEEGFDFSGTRKFDKANTYESISFLTVPLKNHELDIIGVLQLINAKDPVSQQIEPFDANDEIIVQALASQAAVAMTNQQLIYELKHLFESLIHVMADAIDEKSPITGKHCKRVPIIARLIADAVNENQEGSLKEIKFTPKEIYELDIAALLHDCGKVTTPVHVVEKSKKLETIIDRFALIEARLEIFLRDQKIKALENKLETQLIDRGQEELIHQEIINDKNLIKEANLGKESLSDSIIKRIEELQALSYTNLEGKICPIITEDEAKNLKIFKGTLTPEERKIIENHVVMTIKMLSQIPYPKHLKEVPEIAGRHHEKIDGTGYPMGIEGSQMSVRARILAIADIFEALTAPDRPYKDVMKLSKVLDIMNRLAREGHIDPELWKIFLAKKVYLTYAKSYLKPEQIDVDEQTIM